MDINNENQSDEVTEFCIADFYDSLATASEAAGGSARVFGKPEDVTLRDLAEILAVNGVRFMYQPSRCIDNVEFVRVPRFKILPGGMANVRPAKK